MKENEWREEFRRRLLLRMNYLGLNRTDLANLTGITRSTIGRYVAGDITPRADMIPKLAKALIIDVSYLIDF